MRANGKMNPYGEVVFITGASSGIGRATARLLAGKGFKVYGASRRKCEDESFGCGFIHYLQTDVTSDESVKSSVNEVLAAQGHIDIVINAAGIGIAGAVEECSSAEAMRQMDTNYVGVLRVISAVCPSMRARKKGLIINIGSVGGIFSIPFQTLYSSSKFALEALTEGLRIELKPFGIKATLVEPGDVSSGFTASRIFSEASKDSVYGKEFRNSIVEMEESEKHGKPPEFIAQAVLKAISRKNPPVRIVAGALYKLLVFLKRFMSARIVERVLISMYPHSKHGND